MSKLNDYIRTLILLLTALLLTVPVIRPAHADGSLSEILKIMEQQYMEELESRRPEPGRDLSSVLEKIENEYLNATAPSGPPDSPKASSDSPGSREADSISNETLGEIERIFIQSQNSGGSKIFKKEDVRADLPGDDVLVTSMGEPLVTVQEFNELVSMSSGHDLLDARKKVLSEIVEAKLVSKLARQEGLENEPYVEKAVRKTERSVQKQQPLETYRNVNDEEAQWYYQRHQKEFREPDIETQVVFVVRGSFNEANEILQKLQNGKPFYEFNASTTPLPGTSLPEMVQEAVFELEPGQMTGVVPTPIGFFVAKLVGRNCFNHFRVGFIVKDTLSDFQEILLRLKSGEDFEKLAEKENLNIPVEYTPKEIRKIAPEMNPGEISQPITTDFWGTYLVKLQERKSTAKILSATVIAVTSKEEGEALLSRIHKGLDIGKVKKQKVSEKNMSSELLQVAQGLKTGEYSAPVKTPSGYYLVKVEKRDRLTYKPFESVKEEIKDILRTKSVSVGAARRYYEANLARYQKPDPEYLVDIIFAESEGNAAKILAELKTAENEEKMKSLFEKHRKDLREVSSDTLPVVCQNIAKKLIPGQLSSVIETHLGYFIIRLNRVVNPSFIAFEKVKDEIKVQLSLKQDEKARRQLETSLKIQLANSKEKALKSVYQRGFISKIDTVSDEDAETWWQGEKENPSSIFSGLSSKEDFPIGKPEEKMNFKKKNVLLQTYQDLIESLFDEQQVVVNEHLLSR